MHGSRIRHHRYAALLAIMLVGLAALLSGCSGQRTHDHVLDVAFQSEISNLDHTYTTKRAYIILSQLTDDYLFLVDPKTLDYKPLLAKSYHFENDTTLDVKLRHDVHFHDGSKMTARDVVYTYRFVMDPANGARAQQHIGQWLKSVEQTGPYSVRFHLKYAYPLALRDMAITVPIRKAGSYTVDGKLDKSALATHENGLGPYKVVAFSPGHEVTLQRFDDYYQDSPKGRPAIKTIRIHTITDWGAAQAGVLSGELDWLYNVPSLIARNLAASGYAKREVGSSMRIGFIELDAAGLVAKNDPLTQLKVRRGINYAIDRPAIVKNLVGKGAKIIDAACNPVQFGCAQDVRRYAYDPAKAKRLFAEAGYPHGFKLTLWAYREPYVSQAMAHDLRAAGLDVSLRYVKLPVLNKARSGGRIQAYFGTWGAGGTADVAATLDVMWNMGTDRNLARDEELARTIAAASRTRDKTVRKRLYRKALRRIAEQAYWVPLYVFPQNYVMSNDLIFPVPRDGLPRLYRARWADTSAATSGGAR
ncbi:ABC transporter substrate-binding protein [Salinisphaera hydrothermalis]|uniref:ABC transporter substrate-binding protein n=1 Tax=Salinisphaera hydrothermalis TaxID=563188 RepID=UPI003341BD61